MIKVRVLNHPPDCEEKPETFKYFRTHVTDSKTKKPISKARVFVNNKDTEVTNKEGISHRSCVNITHQVKTTVLHDDYFPKFNIFLVEQEMTGEVELEPIGANESLVKMHIKNDEGVFLADASVTMGMYEAVSRSDGVAYLSHVGRGEYNFTVTHKDYSKYTGKINVQKKVENLDIVLTNKTGVIDVIVKDKETGKSIEDADVFVNGKEYLTKEGHVITERLPYGDYEVVVKADNYSQCVATVSVNKDSTQKTFSLTSLKQSTVNIKVFNQEHKPCTRASVELVDKEDIYTSHTDEQGLVHIKDVLFGEYDLTVKMVGYKEGE